MKYLFSIVAFIIIISCNQKALDLVEDVSHNYSFNETLNDSDEIVIKLHQSKNPVKTKFMRLIIYIFLALSFCINVQSQNNNYLYILDVQKFIHKIDSLETSNKNYFETKISDGIIKNSDGKTGGFGIETLSKDDKILKISYSGGIDIYTEKTYYYKSSKLVYAILEISDREQKSLFIKHEIYKDEEIISSRIVKNILKIEDRYNAESSLHKDGLEIFKSESNIR